MCFVFYVQVFLSAFNALQCKRIEKKSRQILMENVRIEEAKYHEKRKQCALMRFITTKMKSINTNRDEQQTMQTENNNAKLQQAQGGINFEILARWYVRKF